MTIYINNKMLAEETIVNLLDLNATNILNKQQERIVDNAITLVSRFRTMMVKLDAYTSGNNKYGNCNINEIVWYYTEDIKKAQENFHKVTALITSPVVTLDVKLTLDKVLLILDVYTSTLATAQQPPCLSGILGDLDLDCGNACKRVGLM